MSNCPTLLQLLNELIEQIDEANYPSLPRLWKEDMKVKLLDVEDELKRIGERK